MELNSKTRLERKKTKISTIAQKSPLLGMHKRADSIGILKNHGKKRGAWTQDG
jgi:hypothetical protein